MDMSKEMADIVRKLSRKQEEERAAFERLSPEEKVEKLKKHSAELLKKLLQARDENEKLKEKLKEMSRRGVSTKTVVCREKMDEVHTALLFICEDRTIKVRCPGECFDCKYGRVV